MRTEFGNIYTDTILFGLSTGLTAFGLRVGGIRGVACVLSGAYMGGTLIYHDLGKPLQRRFREFKHRYEERHGEEFNLKNHFKQKTTGKTPFNMP